MIIGAWALAPLAGEWTHQAALAVKSQLPLDLLRDSGAQFPTFSDGYLKSGRVPRTVRNGCGPP